MTSIAAIDPSLFVSTTSPRALTVGDTRDSFIQALLPALSVRILAQGGAGCSEHHQKWRDRYYGKLSHPQQKDKVTWEEPVNPHLPAARCQLRQV